MGRGNVISVMPRRIFPSRYIVDAWIDGMNGRIGHKVVKRIGNGRRAGILQASHSRYGVGSQTISRRDQNTGDSLSELKEHENFVVCVDQEHTMVVPGSFEESVKRWDIRRSACFISTQGCRPRRFCPRMRGMMADRKVEFWSLADILPFPSLSFRDQCPRQHD
jgi:hypothetical protein